MEVVENYTCTVSATVCWPVGRLGGRSLGWSGRSVRCLVGWMLSCCFLAGSLAECFFTCRLRRPSPYFTWPREAACDYALNGFVTCLGQLRSGKIWRPFRNKLSQPMPWILLQNFSVLPTYLQLKRRRCVQLSSSHICLVTRRHPACPSLSI